MKNKLHIAVACGGTGGHIFPGLATAETLRDRGHHVSLWLAGKGVEKPAVDNWKGPVVTIPAEGFQFGPLRSIVTALRIGLAVIRCWAALWRHRPDAVLAMGSYASIGPCLAARLRGIPYILHEANAVPGRAVRLLSRKAAAVAICFEETRYHLKGVHAVETGMPLRPGLCPPSPVLRSPPSGFSLLVMGGSGGAHALNEIVSSAVCLLKSQNPNSRLHVAHLTGPADESHILRRYEESGVDADVRAFTHDIAGLYQTASLAVCRAGASTCAELVLFGLPALLVPYPHAANDHQSANARALEKIGAADVVQQADMTVEWLADYLGTRMKDPARLKEMSAAARKRTVSGAAEKLAETVEQCARQ
jgi:UDP-N-acetylglucosamine--N-acetylmuramyl-(pentapeptide) pyrophosphoryl-undecaprenol N-acetylglucosamine transferase